MSDFWRNELNLLRKQLSECEEKKEKAEEEGTNVLLDQKIKELKEQIPSAVEKAAAEAREEAEAKLKAEERERERGYWRFQFPNQISTSVWFLLLQCCVSIL